MVDGGRIAARGFLYQYLRTLEAALAALSDERVYACRVEGDPNPTATNSDIVDFDLIDDDERVLLAAQVKSGGPGVQLSISTAVQILVNLVSKVDAQRYELLTNTRISTDTVNLAQVLTRDETIAERRVALDSVLDGTRAREQVAALTDEHIRRLGRCRISTDLRERAELNDNLRQTLREARRRVRRGIGQQSSGLLLAYLQSEVHRRAASPDDAVWTMSKIAHDLGLDDRALADALDARDWGGVLGLMAPIPDVSRTVLLSEIANTLEPYRPAGHTPRRCALTGLSGIGKSSLAAAYLAEYADAYDILFWIDASSLDAIVRDFRLLASRLGSSPSTDPRQMCSLVHEGLSTHTGRWLMVFDDAETTTAAPWIPRLGDGDVLITSIDSTFSISATDNIPINAMLPDEAIQLLTTRLELTTEQARGNVDLVGRLAESLKYWPLALELAASYLRSCGYAISDIPHYVDSLKVRSLDDQHSIPAGYPRTLVAAIDLAAESLRHSESDNIADVAGGALAHACYLASRRIPIHLLVAAHDPEFDNLPTSSGPVIIKNPLVHEAVRALRRVSFARPDQPLPRRESDIATSDYTIAINSVLQEVLRARIENSLQLEEWKRQLEQLAIHLDVWMAAAMHNGEADKAHTLVPHVAVLAGHLQRLNVMSSRVALLIGNLAGVYSGTKRSGRAVELLNTELQIMMDVNEPDEFLVHQTRLHLANALVAGDNIYEINATEAINNLEYIVSYCQRLALDGDTHRAASTFCIHSLTVLDKIAEAGLHLPRAQQLESVFIETLERLPPTDAGDARKIMQRVTRHMSERRYSEAEQDCRRLLVRDWYGSNIQLEIHRHLIESLLYQENWTNGGVEIDSFAVKAGHNPLYRYTIDIALHNIGLHLAGYSLFHADIEPRNLFVHLMYLPCFVEAVKSAQGEYRAKFDLLSLILGVVRQSHEEVEIYSAKVQEVGLKHASIGGNRAWSCLAAAALNAAQRILMSS